MYLTAPGVTRQVRVTRGHCYQQVLQQQVNDHQYDSQHLRSAYICQYRAMQLSENEELSQGRTKSPYTTCNLLIGQSCAGAKD